jgi:hypothetical protein
VEDNMNMQERMDDKRTFRIAVIAVAAAVLLAAAAYLFGTGLRADTPASVAPAPVGANLGSAEEARAVAPAALSVSSLDARGARTTLSAVRAASLAALEKSRSDFHADQNAAAAAARWAAVAAADKDFAIFYRDVNATNAAVEVARLASLRAISTRRPSFLADANTSGAPAAADPYQRMGFASPESVGARLPSVTGAGASGSPSIKPEGIKTDGVLFAAPAQYQWIKPEGITTSETK